MKYLKNIITNNIVPFQDTENPSDKENWISSSKEEYLAQIPARELKDYKINQLNINREAFCLIPIEYQGKTYATTLQAWSSITYLISSLSNLSSSADYFTYPEQEKVTLTKADFKAIANKIQIREIGSRNKREILTIEINNASSIEELNSINIEFN